MEIIIVLGIFFALAAFLDEKLKSKKEKKKLDCIAKQTSDIAEFTESQKLLSADLKSVLVIDESRKKIALLNSQWKEAIFTSRIRAYKQITRVLDYKQILSSEILEDGDSISKTSRMSQTGGLIVGGALLGGVGAIVGGLSGKKTSSKNVEKLALLLVVNDSKDPRFEIIFNKANINSTSDRFKDLLQQARHWHSIVSVLIRQADESEAIKAETKTVENSKGSLTEELIRLKELVTAGILTEAEFLEQKTKILKNS